MRNMLTETRNRHFAERLFYADNLPQSATACYNGNIAALRIDQMDSIFTFAYTYDACNRLKTSNRLTGYGAMFSESFDYDDGGNILHLKRYKGSQLIDDLVYDYGNIGNQVRSISDNGQDADRYSIIEYHNGTGLSDTTMRYDANGNLTSDADRGIAFTRYNILNLPDTIQFNNGNQIINMYDAAGRKYKSITYTLPATAVAPIYEIAHYNFSIDTIHFDVTEYAGNMERRYSRIDTTQRVLNTIGYCQKDTFFYAIKDHLGNTSVIVNAATQLPVQSTVYYASGVPMAQSFGRDVQPYMYNGKEFVESHGYNTFDYGFRGYYAPCGRFTTVDPLAEQTPWLSPYSYAGNNFINAIDWMGLSGSMIGEQGSIVQCIVVNTNGDIIGGTDDGDNRIYIDLDGEWDPKEGKGHLIYVCDMEHSYQWYMMRVIATAQNGEKYRAVNAFQIRAAIGKALINDVARGVVDNFLREYLNETIGPIGRKTTDLLVYTRAAQEAYNIFNSFLSQGLNPQVAYDAAKEILTVGTYELLIKLGENAIDIVPKISEIATQTAPGILLTTGYVMIGWAYYKMCVGFADMYNNLNLQLNSKAFWGNLYGYYNGEDNW